MGFKMTETSWGWSLPCDSGTQGNLSRICFVKHLLLRNLSFEASSRLQKTICLVTGLPSTMKDGRGTAASLWGRIPTLWPHGLKPFRLLCPCKSSSKNTGVGCHALLQGSSQPRDWTQVSRIAGRFFPIWATREALSTLLPYDKSILLLGTHPRSAYAHKKTCTKMRITALFMTVQPRQA